MRDEAFDIPITVEAPNAGRREVIQKASQAAAFLAEKWPQEKRGLRYKEALRLCREAVKRQQSAAAARKAFAEAARDANLLVVDRKPPAFGRKLS